MYCKYIYLDARLYGLLWSMSFEGIKKYVDKHSWLFSTLEYNHKFETKIAMDHGLIE